jgi:hypothetical protein
MNTNTIDPTRNLVLVEFLSATGYRSHAVTDEVLADGTVMAGPTITRDEWNAYYQAHREAGKTEYLVKVSSDEGPSNVRVWTWTKDQAAGEAMQRLRVQARGPHAFGWGLAFAQGAVAVLGVRKAPGTRRR